MDLDGDGDLELLGFDPVAVNVPTTTTVIAWHDDGTGRYLSRNTGQPLPPPQPFGASYLVATSGDVDGDGDEDIVGVSADLIFIFGPPCVQHRDAALYRNVAGSLQYESGAVPALDQSAAALRLGDVDSDGDLDLVVDIGSTFTSAGPGSACVGPDRLLINDGTGVFVDESLARLPQQNMLTSALTFGDIDGDADLDLLVSYSSAAPVAPPQCDLWLNDGQGRFVDAGAGRLPPSAFALGQTEFIDVDADGDLDIAGAILALNDGRGFFTDVTQSQFGAPRVLAVPYADVDGDGDLDAFGVVRPIHFGTRRHVLAPAPPRPGQPFVLRHFAGAGPAVVVPFISFGTGSHPTPFGPFRLDPARALTLAPVFVRNGSADTVIAVPTTVSNHGLSFWSQSLSLRTTPGTGELRLSNAITETILEWWFR